MKQTIKAVWGEGRIPRMNQETLERTAIDIVGKPLLAFGNRVGTIVAAEPRDGTLVLTLEITVSSVPVPVFMEGGP